MTSISPQVVIRLGSHAEKEYVVKLERFLDGLIVGANLFEATPGATASLLLRVGTKSTRLYVDPMTYAYGAYVDPMIGTVRHDLDWIKSDQTRKSGGKVRDFKRSYRRLAEELQGPLTEAVANSRAVSPNSLIGSAQASFCESVARYQLTRMVGELEKDEELRDYLSGAPLPAAIFAPYFYIEPSSSTDWLRANLDLMRTTATLDLGADVPVHGVLCADSSHLSDSVTVDRLTQEIPDTGVSGVWLWFSGFYEDSADESTLRSYRRLVQTLSDRLEVHAMHGGLFSLLLSKWGMTGVSHGIGYGEQKNVVPVIGQSIPMVRYYLPPLARRLGVPAIERAFDALGIRSPSDFHAKVCDCSVCKGIVSTSLDDFSSFGDMHFSRPTAARQSQTPAAAKRCRFHFLLARLRERDDIRKTDLASLIGRLRRAGQVWGVQPSLRGEAGHLAKWAHVLDYPS